jgi:anti-sigma factor RsiW
MVISDNDLELLETYLDGALDAAETESVRRRLRDEPQLVTALEELRGQRAARQAVWRAMEPDQATADRLTWRIRGGIAKELSSPAVASPRRRWDSWQIARVGSAAAACVVLGFFIGWVGRAHHSNVSLQPAGEEPMAVNKTDTTSTAMPTGPISVPVSDEYGRVVAFQKFDNAADARAFTEGLNRARNGAPMAGALPVASPDAGAKLVDTPPQPQKY